MCLAGENLPPLRAGLERCVPPHDISAAPGIRARGRRGPCSNARDQWKTALQPLLLNEASPLLPGLLPPAHFRPPVSAIGSVSPLPTQKPDRTLAVMLSADGRLWILEACQLTPLY